MARQLKVKNHPELPLGLNSNHHDLHASFFDPNTIVNRGALVQSGPSIASHATDAPGRFSASEPKSDERWRRPGSRYLQSRHQIIVPKYTPEHVTETAITIEKLRTKHGLSKTLALALAARGDEALKDPTRFLTPCLETELSRLPEFRELESAAKRIRTAIYSNEKIAIITDYDCDGNCAGAILYRAISALGGRCELIQPDRILHGYGLSENLVPKIEQANPDLVITLDLGTNNYAEIKKLTAQNRSTIVVDHHKPIDNLVAQPDILVSAFTREGLDAYKNLSASGLSWLLSKRLLDSSPKNEQITAQELLPLAMIGTVADVMELRDFNRVLVKQGLLEFTTSNLVGIKTLCNYIGNVTPRGGTAAFRLGPLLNACGRIRPGTPEEQGSALVLKLLTTNDSNEAVQCLKEMIYFNEQRKLQEPPALQEVYAQMKVLAKQRLPYHCGYAYFLPDVHEGQVGLIAARVTEALQCPSVVLTKTNSGLIKGSCRTIEGLDILDILKDSRISRHLLKYGGHSMAAGISLSSNSLQAFQAAFSRVCCERFMGDPLKDSPFYGPNELVPPLLTGVWAKTYRPDRIMSLKELHAELNEIQQAALALEPCGRGNPELKILLLQVKIESMWVSESGHRYVIITAADNQDPSARRIQAVAFARSVPERLLAQLAEQASLNILLQPIVDFNTNKTRTGLRLEFQINMLDTQTINDPTNIPTTKRAPRALGKKTKVTALNTDLFDQSEVSEIQSITDLQTRYGIKYLKPTIEPRPAQLHFIARQLEREHGATNQKNLLWQAGTSGGKTLLALMRTAKALSDHPDGICFYLTIYGDLVPQAIAEAKNFLDLDPKLICAVTGGIAPKKRQANYEHGKIFIGTPQTVLNDLQANPELINRVKFVAKDEIHILHGDNHEDGASRYAYRQLSRLFLAQQKAGSPIVVWGMSGTPTTKASETTALCKTLSANCDLANLRTGIQHFSHLSTTFPTEYASALKTLANTTREIVTGLRLAMPKQDFGTKTALNNPARKVERALEQLCSLYESSTLPSRRQLLETRKVLLGELNALPKDQKDGSYYLVQSLLHELEYCSRVFDVLKSKGRQAFMRKIAHQQLKALQPDTGQAPADLSNYKVRFHRRAEIITVIEKFAHEPVLKTLQQDFAECYPERYRLGFGWEKRSSQTTRQSNSVLLAGTPKSTASKLDVLLREQYLASEEWDPKEQVALDYLKALPTGRRTLIICEEKFEARLLAERLKNSGLSAGWYAGKSEPASSGVKESLADFNDKKLNILCATSAAETGIDFDITDCLRIRPITSPKRNAQTKGRVGRRSEGTYSMVIMLDSDPNFSEKGIFDRALQRLKNMERQWSTR